MLLKDLFLAIPRSTIQTLTRYRLLPRHLLEWYDLIRFFDTLDFSEEARRRQSKFAKPFGQMDKYTLTADHFQRSDEQVRKIIARLNTPISKDSDA
ncbi:MAG: hypothetical protein ACI4TV_04080 [Paludibacteraceae bacterium]